MQLKDGTSLYEGKYQIIRFISEGDFGYTYEAMCNRSDTRVAIKEFYLRDCCERHPYNDEVSASSLEKVELFDKMKRRFVDEARSLFQFDHPNIVNVTDVFLQNGTAYYVMRYVEGVTLKELVKRKGRLSESEALSYMDQLCDAIQYVHSKNRLHLDIRPANVIISSDGRVNLADFGFSKRLDPGEQDPNVSSLNILTNSYSPIELRVDSDATISPVSDIYSLGATLYNLLTGSTPPDAAMLLEYPLSELPGDISANVALTIRKAMSARKEERPQSVKDFQRMLHAPVQASTMNSDTHLHGAEDKDLTDISQNNTIAQTPYNSIRFSANSTAFQPDDTQLDRDQPDSNNEATEIVHDKHAGTDFSKINFGFEPDPQGSERTVIDSHSSSASNGNNPWNIGGGSMGISGLSGANGYGGNNNPNDINDPNSYNAHNNYNNQSAYNNNNHGGYGVTGGDSGLIVEPEDFIDAEAPDNNSGNGSTGNGNSGNGNIGGSTTQDQSRFDIYANRKIKKKSPGLKIAIIIAAILAVGGVGYWAYHSYFSSSGVSTPKVSSSAIAEGTPGVTLGTYAQNNVEKMGEVGEHYWVDLGLPSGTKWATTNIGAENPTDFGGYYAWGETAPKTVYNYENAATYEKPMGEIAGNPTFDAATKLWGESWKLPTKKQYEELLNNCSYRWIDVDGVKGGLFTSRKNGQSIFLPAAGFRYGVIASDTDASYVGSEGAYWTDTPIPNDTNQEYAYGLRLYGSSIQSIDDKFHRGAGRSIRAVTK